MIDSLWSLRAAAAIAGLCVVLGGCASSGTVVLLPQKDGRPTAVSVRQGDKEVVLDQPYAAAKTSQLGPRAYVASPQDVDTQFAHALAKLPAVEILFVVRQQIDMVG